MEKAIEGVLSEIESRGGMVECLRQGYIQHRIAQRAYEHQRAVEKGEVPVVGVNKFTTVGEAHREPDLELQAGSPEAAREAADRARRVKRERDGEAARKALEGLSRAAAGTGNVQ